MLGAAYFCGFSGIWLVLALYLQDGLGFTAAAVRAGGDAVRDRLGGQPRSLAGRLDHPAGPAGHGVRAVAGGGRLRRAARWLPLTAPSHPALWLLVPLFVAGVGGGATISPNITMTLAAVPPRMGGAAGGALQTGQRIGSAIGAAVLAAAFRLTLVAGAGPGARCRSPSSDRAGLHAGGAGDGGARAGSGRAATLARRTRGHAHA